MLLNLVPNATRGSERRGGRKGRRELRRTLGHRQPTPLSLGPQVTMGVQPRGSRWSAARRKDRSATLLDDRRVPGAVGRRQAAGDAGGPPRRRHIRHIPPLPECKATPGEWLAVPSPTRLQPRLRCGLARPRATSALQPSEALPDDDIYDTSLGSQNAKQLRDNGFTCSEGAGRLWPCARCGSSWGTAWPTRGDGADTPPQRWCRNSRSCSTSSTYPIGRGGRTHTTREGTTTSRITTARHPQWGQSYESPTYDPSVNKAWNPSPRSRSPREARVVGATKVLAFFAVGASSAGWASSS